jgi:hypothetical protein
MRITLRFVVLKLILRRWRELGTYCMACGVWRRTVNFGQGKDGSNHERALGKAYRANKKGVTAFKIEMRGLRHQKCV